MVIGKIISVEFDKFRVKLFHTTKVSTLSLGGKIYYFGNIGSYLKTQNAVGDSIICEVTAVLDHNIESRNFSEYNLDSSRELVIKPIGTMTKGKHFSLGVGIFPSIYADVAIVTVDDLKDILATALDKTCQPNIHKEIEIGLSKNLINYTINVNIDRLFNIHTAVLGNSGSGKSNTIAHILQQVFRKSDNYAAGAKTILFDVNGEYDRAFAKGLDVGIERQYYKPNAIDNEYQKPFLLPYYLMNLDEWLAFLMASERTQKPFWDKVLQECFKFYMIFNETNEEASEAKYINYFKWKIRNILTNIISKADTDTAKITAAQGVVVRCREIITEMPVDVGLEGFLDEIVDNCDIKFGNNNNQLSEYLAALQIDDKLAISTDSDRLKPGVYFDYKFLKVAVDIVLLEEEAKGNLRIREFTSTMISRLDYFLFNPECEFMRASEDVTEAQYLEQFFGIAPNSQSTQLVIIDSSEVGPEVLELLTSVVSRMIFDYRKRRSGRDRNKEPVHIVLDEAHRYIRNNADYILRENIFERIAREGRKFAMFLIVSSQRPSELSATVLSQCGNYIIHRVQNEVDIKFIYSVLPYFSDDYISKIKQAVPGEALIFGNCVPMPLQVKISKANPDPNSENCQISKEWFTYIELQNAEVSTSSLEDVGEAF